MVSFRSSDRKIDTFLKACEKFYDTALDFSFEQKIEKYHRFMYVKTGVLTPDESKVRRNIVWRNRFGGMGISLLIQIEFLQILYRLDGSIILLYDERKNESQLLIPEELFPNITLKCAHPYFLK